MSGTDLPPTGDGGDLDALIREARDPGSRSYVVADPWTLRVGQLGRAGSGAPRCAVTLLAGGQAVHADRLRLDRDDDRRAFVRRAAAVARLGAAVGECPAVDQAWSELLTRALFAAAADVPDTPSPTAGDRDAPEYRETDDGIFWLRQTRDGVVEVQLTTYAARIVADIARDDGTEVTRALEIATRMRGREYRATIPAAELGGMGWAVRMMGGAAVLAPGIGMADRARHAIQVLSTADREIPSRTTYAHTGMRNFGTEWGYLHAGGAIGANGQIPGIEVDLPHALTRYMLHPPSSAQALAGAVRASLEVLSVGPLRITVAAYAAVGRAPLGHADLSVHYAGPTGSGKTAFAALAMSHWGAEMWDGHRPPASWSSSANALEVTAHAAMDALLLVDDFAPSGPKSDIDRLHRDADRLLRAQANQAGRATLRSDRSMRAARPPRGLILSTGEDVPRGQSLRARMMIVEMAGRLGQPGADIDATQLAACQADAAAGRFAEAMAGYVQWLAARIGIIRRTLPRRREALRSRAVRAEHGRTPGQVADLALGLGYWLRFARAAGAVGRQEAHDLWRRCWLALGDVASAQAQHQTDADPVGRFLRLVSSAISAGSAHVAGTDGQWPAPAPQAWGWRVGQGDRADDAETSSTYYVPYGSSRIGWVGRHRAPVLWLDPEASFAAAQALGARIGEPLEVAPRTLWRRMRDRGLLLRVDEARQVLTARTPYPVEERRRDVLWLAVDVLSGLPTAPGDGGGPATDGPGGPGGPPRAAGSDGPGLRGKQPDSPTLASRPRNEGEPVGSDPTAGRVLAADPTGDKPCATAHSGTPVGSVGSQAPCKPPAAAAADALPGIAVLPEPERTTSRTRRGAVGGDA